MCKLTKHQQTERAGLGQKSVPTVAGRQRGDLVYRVVFVLLDAQQGRHYYTSQLGATSATPSEIDGVD
jgi:hypothetical protein